jgi:protein-tyrosine phosphatase
MAKIKILFVCTANICRSPIAEGVAKAIIQNKRLTDKYKIDSAGIISRHAGERPCKDSIKITKKHGINISTLHARQVKKEDKKLFDHVVVMELGNKKALKKLGFRDVHLLGEFADFDGINVPDPYGFNVFDERMQDIYNMIEKCVADLIDKIIFISS